MALRVASDERARDARREAEVIRRTLAQDSLEPYTELGTETG